MSEELDWERIAAEPDRERRVEIVLADTFGENEQAWAFYTYWEEHAELPFNAVPRSQVLSVDDEGVDTMVDPEPFEVVQISDASETRGVLCQVMSGEKVRQMPISELVPLDAHNRRIWGDYIAWFDNVIGDASISRDEDLVLEDEVDEELDEDEE